MEWVLVEQDKQVMATKEERKAKKRLKKKEAECFLLGKVISQLDYINTYNHHKLARVAMKTKPEYQCSLLGIDMSNKSDMDAKYTEIMDLLSQPPCSEQCCINCGRSLCNDDIHGDHFWLFLRVAFCTYAELHDYFCPNCITLFYVYGCHCKLHKRLVKQDRIPAAILGDLYRTKDGRRKSLRCSS